MADLPMLSRISPSSRRNERELARAIALVEGKVALSCYQDQARLDRMASTAEHAMIRAARMGALEATLTQAVPNAASYIHAAAVAGAVGIAGVVYDTAREA